MADFRISLGVDVNTEGLQGKINAAASQLEPIKLDVELGDIKKELKSITSELKTLNSKKLLNIDTSTISSLKNVDSIIKNIKTSINSVGQSGSGFDKIGNDIKQVTASIKNAEDVTTHMKKAFKAIDIDFKGADVVTKDLEKMNLEIQKVTTKISGNNIDVSVTGIEKTADGLERVVTASKKYKDAIVNTENVNRTITQTFNTSADALKRTQKENANTVKEINKEMNNFVKLQGKIGQMKTKIGELELAGGKTNQVAELKKQLEELETTYDSLMQKFMKKMTANADVIPMDDVIKFDDSIEAETKKVENALRELDAKVTDTKAKLASGIKGNFSGNEAQIERLTERFEKLSGKPVEVQNGINNLKSALVEMRAASNDDDLIASEKKYQAILKETESQLRKNEAIERQANNADNLDIAKQSALLKLKGLFEENSEAAKRFGLDVQRLQTELNECGNIAGVDKVNKQISNLGKEIKNSGLQTKTFGSKLKAQFDKYKDYLSVASVFMYVSQGLRDMFNQVVAIDTAMTELKKVTNETDDSYDNFLNNAASRAKEIGTTIDGLVTSTADFARLGYDFDQAAGLAEVANIYTVVGDEIDGVEGATQSLVSTLAAFKHEMGDMSDSDFAMSIVDKFNEVSNNFAISSGGIGEALQRSASSLAAANNTLDESIALITAANEVTQNPEKVGKWLCRL